MTQLPGKFNSNEIEIEKLLSNCLIIFHKENEKQSKIHQETDMSKLDSIQDLTIDLFMESFDILEKHKERADRVNFSPKVIAKDRLKELEISHLQDVADLAVEPDHEINQKKIISKSNHLLTRFENLEKNFLNKEPDAAYAERI